MNTDEAETAIATFITIGICDDWVRRQPTISGMYRRLGHYTTPLSDARQRWLNAFDRSDEGFAGLSLDDRIAAFAATFGDLEDEGRELAGCGINDNGLDDVPGWIDWQCYLADLFVRDKAEKSGVPVYVATLASAVMRGALINHILAAVAKTRGNEPLH